MSSIVREHLESHGADLAEVRRLWQEVLAVCWFIDPDCSFYLQMAALNWWHKLEAVRRGDSKVDVKYIEKYLRYALERFAKRRQRWERWLSKELGADVCDGMACVRVAVEGRLGTLQRALGIGHPRGMMLIKNEPKNHM